MAQATSEQTQLLSVPVYPIIHRIRADVIHVIDSPLSYADLTSPELSYSVLKPLEEKYAKLGKATVFAFLLNRVHFLRDRDFVTSAISQSRATLCEILAIRILPNFPDLIELTAVLTTSWLVYAGADDEVLAKALEDRGDDFDPKERVGNAIEMAIISNAKRFIKANACQKVIDAIWSGRCVYQAESSHSLLSDNYKRKPIEFYDPRKAPLLDHYRLKVPAIRLVLEYMNFVVLFVLFVVALEMNETKHINLPEALFMVYALGFSLEKLAAMQEHGVRVYFHGTWNGFDVAFISIFIPYATLRVYGVSNDNAWARSSGTDCLALAACLMFPRLAFVTLRNNLMVLSLRSMFYEFAVLMSLAAFCFCGFLYALWTLSRTSVYHYSASQIAWWMADLWFGLDASGFDKASQFHPYFGPVLMVLYACLSNTLLLTVLVSILSHTFSTISADAEAEAMYRHAVQTIEGVKADALFSYQPPLNLVAFIIMLPASYILTPRWFHKLNVAMIRTTAFPILLIIAFYERQRADNPEVSSFYETVQSAAERVFDSLPRTLRRLTFIEGLKGSGGEIDAIFDIEDDYINDTSALDMRDEVDLISFAAPQNGNGKEQGEVGREDIPLSAPIAMDRSPTHDRQARRFSSSSSRRPRADSSSFYDEEAMAASSSISPPMNPIRNRLNSMRREGLPSLAGILSSPLAQLYQPIVVDDDNGDDEATPIASTSLPGFPMAGIGAIPLRRRLTSNARHRRMATDPAAAAQPFAQYPGQQQSQLQVRFPAVLDPHLPFAESPPHGVAESPKLRGGGPLKEVDEVAISDADGVKQRLDQIEARQQKIEDLLVQLAKDMRGRIGADPLR